MIRKGIKIFGAWLLINLILPFVIPMVFLFLCGFLVESNNLWNLGSALNVLFKEGVFSFFGITFVLSVFQDYPDAKSVFNWVTWSFFFIFISLTGFIFISSLGVIPEGKDFESNQSIYSVIILISALFAVTLKVITTIVSLKKLRYGIW